MAEPESRRPLIFDIHRYALDDGPGIRTTVFFKGCPLACIWCHNPEGMRSEPELCHLASRCIACGDCVLCCPRQAITLRQGVAIDRARCDGCGQCAAQCPSGALSVKGQYYRVAELTALLLKDQRFYTNSGGGVTLSGGEPTLHADYVHQLLRGLKRRGVHVALQTCGFFHWESFAAKLLPWIDLIYFDIKCIDEHLHRQWTGRSNRRILANFARLADVARDRLICAVPLITGLTAERANIRQVARHIGAIADLPYRLQAYNPGGHFKAQWLGKSASSDLPAHAMAPEQYRRLAEEFEAIVNSLRKSPESLAQPL